MDPFQELDPEQAAVGQELQPTQSSSSSDDEGKGPAEDSEPPPDRPQAMHISHSEPVLSKPQRPVIPVRPSRPPRPVQRSATVSGDTSEETNFVVGAPPPPSRPARPPRPSSSKAESNISNPTPSSVTKVKLRPIPFSFSLAHTVCIGIGKNI